MVIVDKETYLLAAEAARHLKISRVKFYDDYRDDLQQFSVGKMRRKHYKLSDLEKLNEVHPVAVAS